MFSFLNKVFKSLVGSEKTVIGLSQIQNMSNDDILQDLTHPASFGRLANNFKSLEGNVTFGNIQVSGQINTPVNTSAVPNFQPIRQTTQPTIGQQQPPLSPFFNTLRKPGL